MRPTPPIGRKRERVIVDYDSDFGNRFLIRTDLIIDPDTNQYISPVTLSFNNRRNNSFPASAVPKRDFTVRKIEICRSNESKEQINTIVCPYNNSSILNQITEIKTFYPNLRTKLEGEKQQELIERGLI